MVRDKKLKSLLGSLLKRNHRAAMHTIYVSHWAAVAVMTEKEKEKRWFCAR